MSTEIPTRPIDAARPLTPEDRAGIADAFASWVRNPISVDLSAMAGWIGRLLDDLTHREAQLAAAEDDNEVFQSMLQRMQLYAEVRIEAAQVNEKQRRELIDQREAAERQLVQCRERGRRLRRANADRLTPEQRAQVERIRAGDRIIGEATLIAILDQHCPRPAPEGEQ